MLPPPPTWLTTTSTMQSMKASGRSCSIRITFIWIRILPPRIGASRNSILTITETTVSETTDPNAQTHLTLKVGVKPRPGTQNGHTVRIIVSFYDLTKDNRMKPTDARVGYDWLTPASDWADATPKFLAATYVGPKTQIASA